MHNIFFAYSWHTRCALLIHIRPHSGHIGHLRDSNDVTSQNGKGILSGPWHPSQGLLCVTLSPTTISSMTILEASWRAGQKLIGMDVFARIYLWHDILWPKILSMIIAWVCSIIHWVLHCLTFNPQGSSSPNKLVFLMANSGLPWFIGEYGANGQTEATIVSDLESPDKRGWKSNCKHHAGPFGRCFVLFVLFCVFLSSSSFSYFFWLLRCSHFFFFQLSLLFLHFYWFSSYVFFLSCCCCCCYGCWWHIYLAVMPTVCCRFDRVCKGQWTRRPKRTSSLVSLFLSLTHGHCVVTLVVVGLCWLWQFCSFKVLPRICIFPVPNGV